MSIDTIFLYHQLEANQCLGEGKESLAAILGLALLGAPFSFQFIKTYLTHQDLAGHPQFSSSWLHLKSIGNDQAFLTTMGIDDVTTFEMLLIPFGNIWDIQTIDQAHLNLIVFFPLMPLEV